MIKLFSQKEYCCPDFVLAEPATEKDPVFAKDPHYGPSLVPQKVEEPATGLNTGEVVPASEIHIITPESTTSAISPLIDSGDVADKASQSVETPPIPPTPHYESYQHGNCGKFVTEDSRIYPWTVVVQHKGDPVPCFGSIISEQFVLTASSCVDGLESVIKL